MHEGQLGLTDVRPRNFFHPSVLVRFVTVVDEWPLFEPLILGCYPRRSVRAPSSIYCVRFRGIPWTMDTRQPAKSYDSLRRPVPCPDLVRQFLLRDACCDAIACRLVAGAEKRLVLRRGNRRGGCRIESKTACTEFFCPPLLLAYFDHWHVVRVVVVHQQQLCRRFVRYFPSCGIYPESTRSVASQFTTSSHQRISPRPTADRTISQTLSAASRRGRPPSPDPELVGGNNTGPTAFLFSRSIRRWLHV